MHGSVVYDDKPDSECKPAEFDVIVEDVKGKRKFNLRCA
jgi:hypothetical protein